MSSLKTLSASGAIYACERFQVIAYNRDGSQSRLSSASSLGGLIKEYSEKLVRMMAHPGTVEVMNSYTTIFAIDAFAPIGEERLMDLPFFG